MTLLTALLESIPSFWIYYLAVGSTSVQLVEKSRRPTTTTWLDVEIDVSVMMCGSFLYLTHNFHDNGKQIVLAGCCKVYHHYFFGYVRQSQLQKKDERKELKFRRQDWE